VARTHPRGAGREVERSLVTPQAPREEETTVKPSNEMGQGFLSRKIRGTLWVKQETVVETKQRVASDGDKVRVRGASE